MFLIIILSVMGALATSLLIKRELDSRKRAALKAAQDREWAEYLAEKAAREEAALKEAEAKEAAKKAAKRAENAAKAEAEAKRRAERLAEDARLFREHEEGLKAAAPLAKFWISSNLPDEITEKGVKNALEMNSANMAIGGIRMVGGQFLHHYEASIIEKLEWELSTSEYRAACFTLNGLATFTRRIPFYLSNGRKCWGITAWTDSLEQQVKTMAAQSWGGAHIAIEMTNVIAAYIGCGDANTPTRSEEKTRRGPISHGAGRCATYDECLCTKMAQTRIYNVESKSTPEEIIEVKNFCDLHHLEYIAL